MSKRQTAWRNMMVAGINAGLQQDLFTVTPGPVSVGAYRFEIAGIPAIASAVDIGFDELQIQVGFWPKPNAAAWIGSFEAGFAIGEASACGWVERRNGAWLQVGSVLRLKCRSHRLDEIAALKVKPNGYVDHGKFMF